jgi:outer membrane protein assembly factor BamB
MNRALARGRKRLALRQASFAAEQHGSGRMSGFPVKGRIDMAPVRRFFGVQRWSARLASLAAAALLVALVGGLLVGLVLVRHNKTATTLKPTSTAQASATATPPARENFYLVTDFDVVIVKVDSTTGTVAWSYKWKKLKEGGTGFGPLAVGGGMVYFAGGEEPGHQTIYDTLYALDASSGALRWSQPAPVRLIYPALAEQGVLYALADGGVYALNASDGSVRWHTSLNADVSGLTLANGILYGTIDIGSVTQWATALVALNAADGKLLLQAALPLGKAFTLSTVVNDTLYLTSVEQKTPPSGALAVESDGKPKNSYVYAYSKDGKSLWQSQQLDGFLSSLQVVNGAIYFTNNTQAFAMSAKDGTLLWQHPADSGIYNYRAPVVFNGVVYVESIPMDSNSTTIPTMLYAFSASDGTMRWKEKIAVPAYTAQPDMCVLANGLLYQVIEGFPSSTLEAFNPGDGSMVSSVTLTGVTSTGLIVAP